MRIYLDVCCLNRPFDEHSQVRIRLESEAIMIILERCQEGIWNLTGSEVIDFEITRIPDIERRQKVTVLISLASTTIHLDKKIINRGKKLTQMSFRAVDALHIACAEKGKCNVFLTTDDQIINNYETNRDAIKIHIANPLNWLEKVTKNGD